MKRQNVSNSANNNIPDVAAVLRTPKYLPGPIKLSLRGGQQSGGFRRRLGTEIFSGSVMCECKCDKKMAISRKWVGSKCAPLSKMQSKATVLKRNIPSKI